MQLIRKIANANKKNDILLRVKIGEPGHPTRKEAGKSK